MVGFMVEGQLSGDGRTNLQEDGVWKDFGGAGSAGQPTAQRGSHSETAGTNVIRPSVASKGT
jgi:hypothetical protein